MTDRQLEGRLRAWYRTEVGDDEPAPLSLRRDVAAIPRSSWRPARRLGRGRGLTLLAAAALLLVGGAVAAGSGLLRLPSLVPPQPAPSFAAVVTYHTSPSPTVAPSPPPAEPSTGPAVTPSPSETPQPGGPARAASWTAIGTTIDSGRPAAVLLDGTVLWTGGNPWDYQGCGCQAQLYDPASGSWTATGNMVASGGQTSTVLLDGEVLVAGGGPDGRSAQLYDPAAGSWTATGNMGMKRQGFTATRLLNGKVLAAGGYSVRSNGRRIPLTSAELYDPGTRTWTATGNMLESGMDAATLLGNGKVLVLSGVGSGSAELYDPASGSWTATGSMRVKRQGFATTLLPDGRVLVAGGSVGSAGGSSPLASAELYDPSTGSWTRTGRMAVARKWFTTTLLLDGKVLVAGGWDHLGKGNWGPPPTSELYDPATGTWTPTARVIAPRAGGAAILLHDGRVLVAGGDGGDTVGALISAELYDPGTGR